MDAIFILVLIGGLGGLVRSLLGYKVQSGAGETFDFLKFVKSIIRGILAGGVIAFTDFNSEVIEPSMFLYISTFFLSVGADVIMAETYGTVVPTKK